MVSTTNQKQTLQPRRSARLLANGAGLTRPPPSSGQVSVPEDTEHSPRRSARQLGDGDKSPSTLQFSGLPSVPEDSEQPTEKPKEMCPVCGWTGNVEIHLAKKKDPAHRAEREKRNTCQCGKTAADFSSRQSFTRHRKVCCAMRGTDEFIEADGWVGSHVTPASCAIDSTRDVLPLIEQQQPSSGSMNVLKNKFVPADHSTPPEATFTRKESPIFPKASDAKSWQELNSTLECSLEAIDYIINSSSIDIDVVVEKFESRMHSTCVEHCGVHSAPVQDHPRRAKCNRPSKAERRTAEVKASLKRQYKAAVRDKSGASERDKKQLARKWREMTRQRRKLRVDRELRNQARKQANEQRKFRSDPNRFAQELFNPPNASTPTFDIDAAHRHFVKTNTDKNGRSNLLEALPEWVRPARPSVKFDLTTPDLKQLSDAVHSKRTKCAPGMNGIPYVVYKKCPAALSRLLKIIQRVWKEKTIPHSWQCGFVVLIPKATTRDRADPAEFRPIALINVEGRLFFTLAEWRLSNYMLANGYMDSQIQKGFLREIGGCVEHSETVYRAALDARTYKRDFVVSWIDLANAYGSVKHSLIQFSLEWYHVPDHFCELMWKYYERLCAAVLVNGDVTPPFWFEVGVFQGCTVSTILFNVAFNTSFAHIQPLEKKCAYVFRNLKVSVMQTGYADDLCITTGTHGRHSAASNNELVLKKFQEWLQWSQTMAAKPKKCIASGLKGGKPFDPELKVWESEGKWFPKYLNDDHFKHLGKDLLADFSEAQAKKKVLAKLNEYVDLVDGTLLNNIPKLWIWANYVVHKISWLFLIHDFPPSFVESTLQPIERRTLKKWGGLPKSGDPSIFFRSKEHFGMGIAELAPLHKKQRLIRRHQLANSKDPRVRQIHNDLSEYQAQRDKRGSLKRGTNEWKECVEMDKLLAEVKTNKIKGSAQTNRAGLGYGPSKHKRRIPSGPKGEREQMLRVFTEIEEEARIVRALTQKKHFSEWLKWQCALAVDLSWQQLLHKQSDSFLRFLLNSIEDSLPTPSVLKCWRQASAGDGKCPLGCNYAGSLKHILCSCEAAHRTSKEAPQSRITWRHDSILLAIYNAVKEQVDKANSADPADTVNRIQNPLQTIFKSASILSDDSEDKAACGNVFSVPGPKAKEEVLSGASDWKVQFDIDVTDGASLGYRTSLPFPPEIAVVSGKGSRPDGVIWSSSSKTVIWIELTSPWEENMSKRHYEKKSKYNQLALELRNPQRAGGAWTVHPLEVEIGARGAINPQSWQWMCKIMGFDSNTRDRLTHAVQDAAVHCSHMIFLCRFHKVWETRPLLDTYGWYGAAEVSE